MPTGISGSNPGAVVAGQPAEALMLVELRTMSNLLQSQSGNVSLDELRVLRNDQAFELGLPVPVPGQ